MPDETSAESIQELLSEKEEVIREQLLQLVELQDRVKELETDNEEKTDAIKELMLQMEEIGASGETPLPDDLDSEDDEKDILIRELTAQVVELQGKIEELESKASDPPPIEGQGSKDQALVQVIEQENIIREQMEQILELEDEIESLRAKVLEFEGQS